MEVAINGDVDALHKALSEGADINYQDPTTGQTVLKASMYQNSYLSIMLHLKYIPQEEPLRKRVNVGNLF